MSSAGLLRSTGVTRLHRYYEPLRLPTEPTDGYLFPRAVACSLARRVGRLAGSLRFLLSLSAPAVRSHPGGFDRCVCSLLRGRWRLHLSWRAGHPQLFNEAESGSLSLRLMPSSSRASDRRVIPWPVWLTTWRTSTYHGSYLSTNKTQQTYP